MITLEQAVEVSKRYQGKAKKYTWHADDAGEYLLIRMKGKNSIHYLGWDQMSSEGAEPHEFDECPFEGLTFHKIKKGGKQ